VVVQLADFGFLDSRVVAVDRHPVSVVAFTAKEVFG
jgi:hypothetical protein